ncbi:hypothetical protein Ddye_026192 [Dipteronia dyeriana]|uniref:Reverse transcriptase domain-containing protein n=1 Tax=Dipteronia dyeriana TaxID=168575 RepID=A0AAD9TMB3_9ROSI|nr:hypothetical protein Ddye_026192 [Dipteronia dyeriana]
MRRYSDSPFMVEEVHKDVFDMGPLKAPGRDGLPAIFYQKFWSIVVQDVVVTCLKCLNEGASLDNMNDNLFTLIPKVRVAEKVSDFRSISLCSVLYEIIAKVLANRLRRAMDKVILESQSAFIHGRLIFNNTIIGFECMHRIKRRKRRHGSMEIKLDMSKAYDRVEWIFVEKMIRKLGFS